MHKNPQTSSIKNPEMERQESAKYSYPLFLIPGQLTWGLFLSEGFCGLNNA